MKLNFILAESALELIPKEALGSPAVRNDSRRREVEPSRMLLDRSLHHSAMARLKDSERRGRPDLVHVALLSVTATPLHLEGNVRIYVHTINDYVIEIAERTRLPKSYSRFRGLMESVLAGDDGSGLVRARKETFRNLLKGLSSDFVLGLSVQGRKAGVDEAAEMIVRSKAPSVVVGGFPRGHFSQTVLGEFDELIRFGEIPLEAQTVAARLIYEVEKASAGINH